MSKSNFGESTNSITPANLTNHPLAELFGERGKKESFWKDLFKNTDTDFDKFEKIAVQIFKDNKVDHTSNPDIHTKSYEKMLCRLMARNFIAGFYYDGVDAMNNNNAQGIAAVERKIRGIGKDEIGGFRQKFLDPKRSEIVDKVELYNKALENAEQVKDSKKKKFFQTNAKALRSEITGLQRQYNELEKPIKDRGFLGTIEGIFDETKKLYNDKQDLREKSKDIKRAEMHPGDIDGAKLMQDLKEKGKPPFNPFSTAKDQYFPTGTPAGEAFVKSKEKPVIFGAVSESYKNEVATQDFKTRIDIARNRLRLEGFLSGAKNKDGSNKTQLSEQQSTFFNKLQDRKDHFFLYENEYLRAVDGALFGASSFAARSVAKSVNYLGKGIVSELKTVDSKQYQRYVSFVEREMHDFLAKHSMSSDEGSLYLRNQLLNLANDPSFVEMMNGNINQDSLRSQLEPLWQKEIENYKTLSEAKQKELEKFLEDSQKKLVSGLEEILQKKDEANPVNIMAASLMLGPFFAPLCGAMLGAAGATIGPLGVLFDIIEPMFISENGATFSEGVASMTTDHNFGVLGQFMEVIKMPELVDAVLNAPLVEVVTGDSGLIQATLFDSSVQGVVKTIAPITGAPALGVAAGVAAVAYTGVFRGEKGADSIIQRFKEEKDFTHSIEKEFKEGLKKYENSKEEIIKSKKPDIEKGLLNIGKSLYLEKEISEYLSGVGKRYAKRDNNILEAILSQALKKNPEGLDKLKAEGIIEDDGFINLNSKNIDKFMKLDFVQQNRKEILGAALYFMNKDASNPTLDSEDRVAAFERDSQKDKSYLVKQAIDREQEAIFDRYTRGYAKRNGIDTRNKSSKDLEKEIVDVRVNRGNYGRLTADYDSDITPPPSITPRSGRKVGEAGKGFETTNPGGVNV